MNPITSPSLYSINIRYRSVNRTILHKPHDLLPSYTRSITILTLKISCMKNVLIIGSLLVFTEGLMSYFKDISYSNVK
jgi:hypothetical protein